MSPLRAEIRKMASLAAPVAATQLAGMMIGFVDTAMVGRVSVEALGAVALANVWIYGTMEFAAGVVMGIAPIVAQAHGAGDGERAGRALQTGVLLAALLSVPVALLWLGTESFLVFARQDPELARIAHAYTLVQIPSIPFYLSYIALRQYLQGREYMRPALWIMIAANIVHALLNWVLIFGHLGFPALGVVGAGIATTLTRDRLVPRPRRADRAGSRCTRAPGCRGRATRSRSARVARVTAARRPDRVPDLARDLGVLGRRADRRAARRGAARGAHDHAEHGRARVHAAARHRAGRGDARRQPDRRARARRRAARRLGVDRHGRRGDVVLRR